MDGIAHLALNENAVTTWCEIMVPVVWEESELLEGHRMQVWAAALMISQNQILKIRRALFAGCSCFPALPPGVAATVPVSQERPSFTGTEVPLPHLLGSGGCSLAVPF